MDLFAVQRGFSQGIEGARSGKPLLAPAMPPLCPLFALTVLRTNAY